MGAVYRAEDTVHKRVVALKLMASELAGDTRVSRRFVREARAAMRLNHPNVVATLDAGEHAGGIYIATELVPGGSLSGELSRRGRIPWREAARLAAQVARGLDAIHRAGLVHRDLKPGNVLTDGLGHAKVADFGLVLDRGGVTASSPLTKSGELLGTLDYMAPEQAEGSKVVGPWSDLYSLGATLHALISGGPPFIGSGVSLVVMHIREPPPPLRSLVPDVPEPLERLVLRWDPLESTCRHASLSIL